MSEKAKKTITVGELIEQKYGLSEINIPQVDLSGIQKAAQTIQPILEQTRKTFEKFQKNQDSYDLIPSFSHSEVVLENYKPTNVYILEEMRLMTDELKQLNEHLSPRKKQKTDLLLNMKNKTLTRDTDNKSFTFKFSERGMNFKLVKMLVDHEGFKQTRHIRKELQSKSNEAVRKKVLKINNEIAEKLRDKKLKLIIGESGAGYQINPDLKIYVVEE